MAEQRNVGLSDTAQAVHGAAMAGPLQGIKIVEMGGIGPAPFAAMMLADHGAEVIRVERAGMIGFENDPLRRSRRSISLDLKQPEACEVVRRLAAKADGLIEGYRPGVMERLGLGPDELLSDNPKLVYGRVTGWGQDGPLAKDAGHDINYVALTGLLHGIGPKERPVAPINYLGDYAGGGMMLAFGMVSALLAVSGGGDGQVVDAAMSDGAALIGAMTYGLLAAGLWKDEREANLLDGGSRDLRHLSLLGRQVPRGRGDRAAVPAGLVQGPGPAARVGPRGNRCGDQEPHPRRMGRPFRRDRRLRRARPRPRRGAGSPAQYRSAHLSRPRRRVPAGAGAALFGDGARSARSAAPRG